MNATITPEDRFGGLPAYTVEPGSTDLSLHSEYGRFEEVGCEWIAHEPDSEEHHYLVLQLRPFHKPSTAQEIISMYHDNLFGHDVEDVASLEAVTDYLVSELTEVRDDRQV